MGVYLDDRTIISLMEEPGFKPFSEPHQYYNTWITKDKLANRPSKKLNYEISFHKMKTTLTCESSNSLLKT